MFHADFAKRTTELDLWVLAWWSKEGDKVSRYVADPVLLDGLPPAHVVAHPVDDGEHLAAPERQHVRLLLVGGEVVVGPRQREVSERKLQGHVEPREALLQTVVRIPGSGGMVWGLHTSQSGLIIKQWLSMIIIITVWPADKLNDRSESPRLTEIELGRPLLVFPGVHLVSNHKTFVVILICVWAEVIFVTAVTAGGSVNFFPVV